MAEAQHSQITPIRRFYVCCHELDDLPIPGTFSLANLAAALRERRGRPVYVLAMRSGPGWARAWIADPATDWIAHRHTATRGKRIGFAVHQAAHMLLGHQGRSVDALAFTDLLFPGLHLALGTRSRRADMTCGIATGDEEREASALATRLLRLNMNPATIIGKRS
jgi:hypothetical protein